MSHYQENIAKAELEEKELLIKESNQTGFRAETSKKDWRLVNILEGINAHPFLKEPLVSFDMSIEKK